MSCKTIKKIVLITLSLFSLTSCAFVSEQVEVQYIPSIKKYPVCTQPNTEINVVTLDNRRSQCVGCKKGQDNLELGNLSLKNDIAEVVKEAITAELEKCNFQVNGAGNTVEIEINRYNCEYKTKVYSYSCEGEIQINVIVIKTDGNIVYTKSINGVSDILTVCFSNVDNAKKVLEAALSDAICKLFHDKAFIQALQK